jgi:hypothetical protein
LINNDEIEEEMKEAVSEDEDNFFSKLHRVVNSNNNHGVDNINIRNDEFGEGKKITRMDDSI